MTEAADGDFFTLVNETKAEDEFFNLLSKAASDQLDEQRSPGPEIGGDWTLKRQRKHKAEKHKGKPDQAEKKQSSPGTKKTSSMTVTSQTSDLGDGMPSSVAKKLKAREDKELAKLAKKNKKMRKRSKHSKHGKEGKKGGGKSTHSTPTPYRRSSKLDMSSAIEDQVCLGIFGLYPLRCPAWRGVV